MECAQLTITGIVDKGGSHFADLVAFCQLPFGKSSFYLRCLGDLSG